MKTSKKILSLIAFLVLSIAFLTSCGKENTTVNKEDVLSEEEINAQYEDLVKSETETLLPEGYNPITDSFTTVDFQFTMIDDTTAFNIPENSCVTITSDAANYSFLDASIQGDCFEGVFKTAKGLSLENTISEFLESYKLDNNDILCFIEEGLFTPYEGNTAAQKISFGFASLDGLEFSPLPSEKLLPILLNRGTNSFSDADVENVLGSNQTVTIIDVIPRSGGNMREFTFTRFDKTQPSE